jgi:hypothetical protein
MITRRQVMKTLALGSTVLAADFLQRSSFAQQTPTATATCPTPTPDTSGLDEAFQNAVAAFRAGDPSIGGLLDTDVTVFSVNTKQRYKTIAEVEAFFTKDFKNDKPSFTPNLGYNVFSIQQKRAQKGVIIGTACWNDNNGPETIGFVFQWVKPQGGVWKIRHLYAD